ncbi:MAG: hypothetical protein JNL87_17425 [Burkholderiaceae bacterium]|nr:hypothetical protein [Burkholderiaceae bacterium]
MVPDNASFQTTRPRERLMAAVAALTTSAGITGALVMCFDTASPDRWLVPDDLLLSQVARCEQQASRKAKDDCKRQLVAAHLARGKQPIQLARH